MGVTCSRSTASVILNDNIFGKQSGNIFTGVPPSLGYEGDLMYLLFDKLASPHHGFAAYCPHLEKIFTAYALLHFGTPEDSIPQSMLDRNKSVMTLTKTTLQPSKSGKALLLLAIGFSGVNRQGVLQIF
jgi:hypothetical protein